MRVLGIPRALTRSVEGFRGCFSSAQFAHFQAYLLGLMLGREGRNIQDIAAMYPKGCDQATLNHFVADAPWSAEAVWESLRRQVWRFLRRTGTKQVWLSVDDTVSAKPYGRRMEGAGYHYSTSAKRPVWGHDLVAAIVSAGKRAFAWDARMYQGRRQCRGAFRSKVQMAQDFIRGFAASPPMRVTVLGDAWYFQRGVVAAAQERSFDWIFGCKRNRRIRCAGGVVSVSQLAKRLPPDQFRRITIHGRQFVVASRVVDIPKIGPVQVVLYVEVRAECGRIQRKKLRCIATNRCDWTARTALAGYMQRQRIEEFFKDAKLHLGLGEYQMRKAQGIQRHWLLVACAHAVLLLLNRKKTRRTIGRTLLRMEDLTQEAAMKWSHRQGSRGIRWSSPLCRVA